MWSRNSLRIVRTRRSAIAFAFGGLTGALTLAIPNVLNRETKAPSVDRIAIVDQMCRLTAPRRGLEHLAPDPSGARAGGDIEMHQLSPLVIDQEEDVEDPVVNGLDNEQVGGPDTFQVVGQESSPGLAVGRSRPPPAVGTGRPVTDRDSQFEQLSPDAFGPPIRILPGHSR